MQEERGSVENTPATTEEKKVEVKNKKVPKKKESKIPTVSAIVEKETSAAVEEKNISESDKKTSGSEQNESKKEDKKSEQNKEVPKPVESKSDESKTEVEKTEKSFESKEESRSEEKEFGSEEQDSEIKNNEKKDGSVINEESNYPDEDENEVEETARRRANLNLDSETALIETVLFLESEPQNTEHLAKISQLSVDVVNEALARLREKYSNADSGIEIAEIIGGWMLVPKKDSFDLVKEKYGKKNEGRLSKAAIETLSIIAYSQPITRAEIESIRHVNADNMMRVLIDRHFIKEVGKKDIPGKPILYGTTKEFLEFFHLQSVADLPQLDEKESERFELAR